MKLGHTVLTAVKLWFMISIDHSFNGCDIVDLLLFVRGYLINCTFVSDEAHIVDDVVFKICDIHENLQKLRLNVKINSTDGFIPYAIDH